MSLASVDNSILAVPERLETNGIACGGSEDIDIASKMADGEIRIDLLLELRYQMIKKQFRISKLFLNLRTWPRLGMQVIRAFHFYLMEHLAMKL